MWGASGDSHDTVNYPGGAGGYVSGTVRLLKGNPLYIYIGQKGVFNASSYNGGGTGIAGGSYYGYGYSGGGGTDMRTIGGLWDTTNSLRSRIIATSGGGSGGYLNSDNCGNGGEGGGLMGYYSRKNICNESYSGQRFSDKGGDQTTGGSFSNLEPGRATSINGSFGVGGTMSLADNGINGGGGGWYGGGSAINSHGSSGGSSYISGHTGSVGVTSTSDSSPKSGCTTETTNNACSLTPYINPATGTSYTFTNTLMIDGAGYKWTNTKQGLQQMPNPAGGYYASGVGHSGNGAARITYLGTVI